jgi:ferredoxin-NADP reductase
LFRRATVARIVKETADARTFVLAPHDGPLTYRAGQFCTFRVQVNGRMLLRSYSMSSAPETDDELMTTVKRVPGGAVSNWLHDNVTEGDELEMTLPAGRFCLRPSDAPMLGFCGGSGITPILSLAKSTLATTDRRVRLLRADRDRPAMIFDTVLAELVERYPDRLSVVRHLDDERGLLTPDGVREFVGADVDGDAYVCGPEPFMALV